MSQDLFAEFPANTRADWEQQASKELKGERPASLNWQNENGFSQPAYLTPEDLQEAYRPAFTHRNWRVCVSHRGQAEALNRRLLRDLGHGAEGLCLDYKPGEFEAAMQGVHAEYISLQLRLKPKDLQGLSRFVEAHPNPKALQITLFPFSLASESERRDWQAVEAAFAAYPNIRSLSVDALEFSTAQALPAYELALTFAQLIEHLAQRASASSKAIAIRCASDSDFFTQIAKLRAYRRLWKLISESYGCNQALYLCVESAVSDLSLSDAYNNLLRNSLSGMAAVLGGCNELCIMPYDCLLNGDSAFASRLAMNQQFIFKHECYLDKLGDVACGSYYIESLTDALCRSALSALQAIEKAGGYFASLKSGEITKTLNRQAQEKAQALAEGRLQRVGVNVYRNPNEKLGLSQAERQFVQALAPFHPLLNLERQQL